MSAHQSRRARVQQALVEEGADVLLVFSPEHLYYLTGIGDCHSPACALIPSKGRTAFLVAQSECPGEKPDEIELIPYFDNTLERPCNTADEMCRAAQAALKELPLPHGRIAIEGASVPCGMVSLAKRFKIANMTPLLEALRCVKDAAELAELRAAVALVDFGQEFAQREARPGMSEIELFGMTHAAIQSHARRTVILQGDLLSGERTLLMGGPATSRKLGKADAVIVDLQVCGGHYWADTTRTFSLGAPSDGFKRLFDIAAEALDRAIRAVKPGVPANAVDRAAREFIASRGYANNFPHHTGHGCGLRYYEPPLIVPNNPEPLAAGMVLCLEPGIYVPGVGGVRLEQMVLVTPSGAEMLSRAPIALHGGMA